MAIIAFTLLSSVQALAPALYKDQAQSVDIDIPDNPSLLIRMRADTSQNVNAAVLLTMQADVSLDLGVSWDVGFMRSSNSGGQQAAGAVEMAQLRQIADGAGRKIRGLISATIPVHSGLIFDFLIPA